MICGHHNKDRFNQAILCKGSNYFKWHIGSAAYDVVNYRPSNDNLTNTVTV